MFTTLGVTTFDFFQQLVVLSKELPFADWLVFTMLLEVIAFFCAAMTTHALLSLWRGTSFVKDIVDYEPEPISMS
ncbi:hypothetical protein WBJ53_02700 [Spirosoma sp. SC4-14]|uniref:hypothetical protein n=1 Tax=Spirosoma sp. SC4-14 TaxID=3128900 RepID=UPI0030D544CE